MKRIASLITLTCLLACAGCKTGSFKTVRTTTANIVLLGAVIDPSVTPYVAQAAPVVCLAAATGTNSKPEELIIAIDARAGSDLKTIGAVIAMNSILAIYNSMYESGSGTNVQATLEGICLGMKDALAILQPPGPPTRATMITRSVKLPPHIKR